MNILKAIDTIVGGHKREGAQLVARQIKARDEERKEAKARKRRAEIMAMPSKLTK
jgi:hypothetical protein